MIAYPELRLNIKGESYRLEEKRKAGILAKKSTPIIDDEMAESGQCYSPPISFMVIRTRGGRTPLSQNMPKSGAGYRYCAAVHGSRAPVL
ncbi:hypothetical protein DLR41_24355 [Salmonella enterica subsp. enterica serovar Panama]|nr:hypothetical protein [Salmonella enterica subsp. enterica serovar Panama]